MRQPHRPSNRAGIRASCSRDPAAPPSPQVEDHSPYTSTRFLPSSCAHGLTSSSVIGEGRLRHA